MKSKHEGTGRGPGSEASTAGVLARTMPRHVALVVSLAFAVGCRSVAQAPSADEPKPAAADATTADGGTKPPVVPPSASATGDTPLPPLAWGTRPSGPGPLYPVVDGMCIHGTVFPLRNGAVIAYGMAQGPWSRGGATTAQILGERGLAVQADEGFGKAFGFWSPSFLGGTLPNRLFATVDVSSRMVSATDLYVGGSQKSDWKVLLASGARFGDAGNAAETGVPVRELGRVVPLDDGSHMIAEHGFVRDAKGEVKDTRSFRVLGADGAWVVGAKVPGKDLAEIAFGSVFARLGNGEVIGAAEGEAKKLVRWSPVRAVDDLPLPKPSKRTIRVIAGKNRAYVDVDGTVYVYENDALVPAKAGPRITAGAPWAIDADDALVIALPGKTLLREARDGTVTEEPLPESGSLYGFREGAPWLVAAGKGANGSDVLFRKAGGAWQRAEIPAPPFGNELRGPLKVEQLVVLSPDDVLVNVRRVEKGYGWKDTEPFRAIYRSKKPDEVLRCQDTRGSGTGVGFHPWPPAADDGCKTPTVVIMPEPNKTPAKDYPVLRQRLRGKTELGESLAFVDFEGRGTTNLAVLADDMTKAKALATLVSKSLDLRAEVVCGRPTPTRTFRYDVAKGTFAF